MLANKIIRIQIAVLQSMGIEQAIAALGIGAFYLFIKTTI